MNGTTHNLAQDLSTAVLLRNERERHAESDCNFVLDTKWGEWKPAYFYGIAHILRHAARRTGLDPEFDKKSKEDRQRMANSLVRMVGWADEFYWLSSWRLTGKLKDVPRPEAMVSQGELLLLALLHIEWAGMLQEALAYWRWVFGETASTSGFQVWNPEPYDDVEAAFKIRAQKRLNTAQDALREFKGRLLSDEIRPCIRDLERNFYIIRARDEYLAGAQNSAIGALNDAAARSRDGDMEFIRRHRKLLLDEQRVTCTPFHEMYLEAQFEPLHILAGWIMDLLGGDDRDAVHPRAYYAKSELHPGADAHQFPNAEAIGRLETRLADHRGWLKFAASQKGVDKNLKYIGDAAKESRSSMFPAKNADRSSNPPDWELYVLRDWASYTPLVPRRDDEPPSSGAGKAVEQTAATLDSGRREQMTATFGGGYFLIIKGVGVAVDPGYDYIENLYAAGLNIGMITDVIVTHDHYDHVASFGPVLSLIREHRRELRDQGSEADVLPKVKFFLSRGVYGQYARALVDLGYYEAVEIITDYDRVLNHIHKLSDGKTWLYTTHTEHGHRDGFGRGVGLKFVFGGNVPVLGITSDTGWYSEYELEGREGKEGSLAREFCGGAEGGPEVMVLHVGSLKRSELRDSGFYKTHLGARGVFLTIDAIKSCRLAVLGEFGEECHDYRAWFAQCLTKFFRGPGGKGAEFNCLPSDRKTYICARDQGIFVNRNSDFDQPQPYQNVTVKEGGGEIEFCQPQL